jgi:hypothetical protein
MKSGSGTGLGSKNPDPDSKVNTFESENTLNSVKFKEN